MREDQFLRQRLQKEIPIEISPVLRDLISYVKALVSLHLSIIR